MNIESIAKGLRAGLLLLLAVATSAVGSLAGALAWGVNRWHPGWGAPAFAAFVAVAVYASRRVWWSGISWWRAAQPRRTTDLSHRAWMRQTLVNHPQRTVQTHAFRHDLDGALATIAPLADEQILRLAQETCTTTAVYPSSDLAQGWLLLKQWQTVKSVAALYGQDRAWWRLLDLSSQACSGWLYAPRNLHDADATQPALKQAIEQLHVSLPVLSSARAELSLANAYATLRTGYLVKRLCAATGQVDLDTLAAEAARDAAQALHAVVGTRPAQATEPVNSPAAPAVDEPATQAGTAALPADSDETTLPTVVAAEAPATPVVAPPQPKPRKRPVNSLPSSQRLAGINPGPAPEADIPAWLLADRPTHAEEAPAPTVTPPARPKLATPKRVPTLAQATTDSAHDTHIDQGSLF